MSKAVGLVLFTASLFFLVSPAEAASFTINYDTFGTLAGATFGGGGIPNDAVAISTFVDGNNTITIGLTAHERYFNPAVLNDGAGTFYATPGSNQGDPSGPGPSATTGATWNFAYYISITGGGTLDDYVFDLFYDFDPAFNTDAANMGVFDLDAVYPGPSGLQDSQNLLFGFLSVTVPGIITAPSGAFSPFAAGQYTFALRTNNLAGLTLDTTAIQVEVVPEPASLLLLGGGLVGLAGRLRRRRMS